MPDLTPRPRRPWPVALAGIIFLVAGACILVVHVALMLERDIIDWPSYGTATLLLVAGLFWLGRPRSHATYYVGGLALIACTVRTTRTAWAQYHSSTLIHYFPKTLVLTLFLIVLTWCYLFGKPSRAYFSM